MGLDEYQPPKGAYFTPALVARFDDVPAASRAIDLLRAAGYSARDIQVERDERGVTVVISDPAPDMLDQGRQILQENGALDLHPYGSR